MEAEVGLVTMDMRFASRFRRAAERLGLRVIHVSEVEDLPLSVSVVVARREEGVKAAGRLVLYAEDYGAEEALAERAMEAAVGKSSYKAALVAIDPGKTIGAAYLVDNKIIKTARYYLEEKLIDDVKRFIERHREAEEKIMLIGATSSPDYAGFLAEKIRRSLRGVEGLRVEVVDEEGTGKALLPKVKGMSRDEYSALILSLRNLMKVERG